MAIRRDKVKTAVDSIVLNVPPVQTTLVPVVLGKLFVNVVLYRLVTTK